MAFTHTHCLQHPLAPHTHTPFTFHPLPPHTFTPFPFPHTPFAHTPFTYHPCTLACHTLLHFFFFFCFCRTLLWRMEDILLPLNYSDEPKQISLSSYLYQVGRHLHVNTCGGSVVVCDIASSAFCFHLLPLLHMHACSLLRYSIKTCTAWHMALLTTSHHLLAACTALTTHLLLPLSGEEHCCFPHTDLPFPGGSGMGQGSLCISVAASRMWARAHGGVLGTFHLISYHHPSLPPHLSCFARHGGDLHLPPPPCLPATTTTPPLACPSLPTSLPAFPLHTTPPHCHYHLPPSLPRRRRKT